MERYKYVIRLINTDKYLLTIDYNNRWVDLESAQFFDYNPKIKKASQLVDHVWIMDDKVELKIVKLKIEIEFINSDLLKKEYLFSVSDKKRILNKNKIKYFNDHGTIIKKEKLLHTMIKNIVRDKHYLNGVNFKKKKAFETTEYIMESVKKIKNYEENYLEIYNIYPFITINDLEKIKNKLIDQKNN